MNKIKIYEKFIVRGNKEYDFIINQIYFGNKKANKTYEIKENGKEILCTSLQQTFYKYMRQISK